MKSLKTIIPSAMRSLPIVASLWFVHLGAAGEPQKQPAGDDLPKDRIEIRDFMFKPAILTVKAGTKVTFVNLDEEPHTVASADGKFTKSKPLDTDQTFTVTLNAPGEYAFFCTVHPHMTGKIKVTAP